SSLQACRLLNHRRVAARRDKLADSWSSKSADESLQSKGSNFQNFRRIDNSRANTDHQGRKIRPRSFRSGVCLRILFRRSLPMTTCFILSAFLGLGPQDTKGSDDLAPPVKILAGGQAINVDIGHAAPFFADIDGRGVKDLLVGQFGDGKLRIY